MKHTCISFAGFQSISYRISFDAPVKFKPTPPAFELNRKTTKRQGITIYTCNCLGNETSHEYPMHAVQFLISSKRFDQPLYTRLQITIIYYSPILPCRKVSYVCMGGGGGWFSVLRCYIFDYLLISAVSCIPKLYRKKVTFVEIVLGKRATK